LTRDLFIWEKSPIRHFIICLSMFCLSREQSSDQPSRVVGSIAMDQRPGRPPRYQLPALPLGMNAPDQWGVCNCHKGHLGISFNTLQRFEAGCRRSKILMFPSARSYTIGERRRKVHPQARFRKA
jgi:hypothetical protein